LLRYLLKLIKIKRICSNNAHKLLKITE